MTSLEEPTVRKIGRYEVIRKIATGGMAELFLARFVGPGGFEKRCALKRILPQLAVDGTFTKMFLTEARVTAMFDHPNLVQIFELGQDEAGQFYIAMELVNGMNLRQLIGMARERGRLVPPELALYMIAQTLDGLAYAHEFRDEDGQPLNLVHRDMSPQNILVSYEGAVKVVDFGIVKGNSIPTETLAGMLKGKVSYMSPEQASGEPIDARSDLFSVGVCLYELVTGEKPFEGANELMCLKAVLEQAPPPVTRFAPDCPEPIIRIILRALAKLPDDRYQSARELLLEIHEVLKTSPTPLGRHVIAEYLRSLTEAGNGGFDATRVRITSIVPRPALAQDARPAEPAAPEPAPRPELPELKLPPPRAPSIAPRARGSSVVAPPRTEPVHAAEGPGEPTPREPTARESSARDLDLKEELAAAGLERRSPLILVVAAAALAGGLAVYVVKGEDRTVVVEVPARTAEAGELEPKPAPDPAAASVPAVAADPTAEVERGEAKAGDDPRAASAAGDAEAKRRLPAPAGATARDVTGPAAAEASTGTLTLRSEPRGLTVMRDGEALGKTPLVDARLPAGTHTLRLVSKPLGISKKMTVRVTKGERTTEDVAIGKGTLKVNSRPWSEVYVDGVSKGKTPLETPVFEGTHEVRLASPEAAGERIQKVDIQPGQTEDIRVKF